MLERRIVESVMARGLAEDSQHGDLTSQLFVPADAVATADLVAREPGIFAGVLITDVGFTALDPHVRVEHRTADGEPFGAGDVLATITGNARAVLQCERVTLNLLQRMCGIATLTAQYVKAVGGATRVTDTRKTTVGLRALERHAVRCGGGHNHRFSLSDAVMAKDNHLAMLGDITGAIRDARSQLPHTTHLEVEVDSLEQIEAVLDGGVDTIMLDNFSLADLRKGVELIGSRALVEASGGVTLDTIADIASTGVDLISVGALTHSVRHLDLGLDLRVS